MDREKVISTFEKIISVCKEDGCDFVDLSFEDAEQILALLKEQKEIKEQFNEENEPKFTHYAVGGVIHGISATNN